MGSAGERPPREGSGTQRPRVPILFSRPMSLLTSAPNLTAMPRREHTPTARYSSTKENILQVFNYETPLTQIPGGKTH